LLEAMMAGKPVIASNVGAIPEIVIEGETGVLVDAGDEAGLADAVDRLVKDDELRRAMGQNGRRRAERVFGVAAMVERTEALYADLMAGAGTGRAR